MLKTAWYCQNGCQMHWMAHKPEFRCPYCDGEFMEDDRAFMRRHPATDLGHYAKTVTSKYAKAKPPSREA